ncbi:MFS transporter [Prauserella coralliicola]|nr:MFS transporter [Prauserella coralliicola]
MTTVSAGSRKSTGSQRWRIALWNRKLDHYPDPPRRMVYLGITVVATILLYYELYVQGAVAPSIIAHFDMSFMSFVSISVVGALVGAFGSLAAGLADRFGRANIVVVGLFVTGLIVLIGLPHSPNTTTYLVLFSLLSLVEGMILVATPALVRDFSPQLGRASAMAFWTMGPVLGSLATTAVSSTTLDSYPDWRVQFYICGAIGLAVAVLALLLLRELSPQLRNQIMVSLDDRSVIEARAKEVDESTARKGQWRQMLHLDIIGSSIAISVFLTFYYIAVGFFIVYFTTVYGYSEARANALANWYWIFTAIAQLTTGFLSDKLRVRKPFMIVGAFISIIGVGAFAQKATDSTTSFGTLITLMIAISVGQGITFSSWLACFSETVERRNPAGTATGLAVWGWTIRVVLCAVLVGFGVALPSPAVLVDHGTKVNAIAQALPPDTEAALQGGPDSGSAQRVAIRELISKGLANNEQQAAADLAYFADHKEDVVRAGTEGPRQWARWWWICLALQVVFIPFVFLMSGRWRPSTARRDAELHEQRMAAERERLRVSTT